MKILAVIEREGLAENARLVGDYLKSSLRELAQEYPHVIRHVRGLGLMLGIEITRDRKTKQKAPELRDAIINECFRQGLLLLAAGPSSIRLSPPLIIDEEQAQFAIDTLSAAISAVGN